jgi:hypothetical protein
LDEGEIAARLVGGLQVHDFGHAGMLSKAG